MMSLPCAAASVTIAHANSTPGMSSLSTGPVCAAATFILRPMSGSLRGIEIAVKVGSPVTPPGQAAARLVDVVEIDLRDQQLRSLHRRLLHDPPAEGIDDRAHPDVTPAILVADPVGGDHEHAIVEGARLQRQVPDGYAVV